MSSSQSAGSGGRQRGRALVGVDSLDAPGVGRVETAPAPGASRREPSSIRSDPGPTLPGEGSFGRRPEVGGPAGSTSLPESSLDAVICSWMLGVPG